MIGLTRYDDNQVINDYKAQYGINNPCAGQEGGAGKAIDTIIEGQPFLGAPTYCVICPDRKMNFNVCFPPTPSCFDDYIFSCGATSTGDIVDETSEVIIYPNPANSAFSIQSNDEIKKITIYNLIGGKVLEKQSANQFDVGLDIRMLDAGIYLVEITTSKGTITKKLAVE